MKRLYMTLAALTVIVAGSRAQSLTAQDVEVQTDEGTELVVSLSGGTTITALQFNLTLPEGVTLNEGTTSASHTLCIEPLASGAYLFVLYSEDQNAFSDGELLRIPLTAGSEALTAEGTLTKVRTATVDAVSHTCADATFAVTVNETATGIGEVQDAKDKTQRGDVFDLSGRRVEQPSRGIYIVGGKKEVIR